MKRENIVRKIIQVLLVCLMPVCCTVAAKYRGEYGTPGKEAQSVPRSESTGGEAAAELNEVKDSESIDKAKDSESTDETDDSAVEEKHSLIPARDEWQEGDMDYDPRDTIYYKTYYDDFVRGYIKHIEYPDINIRGELEDYFRSEEYDFKRWDNLVEMFFDSRTIETPEEELKELFYQHGYLLCFQNAEMKNLHVRFVEITEIGGLSLYPSRIMIQTWDENCIYLQDITSPIPRKVMGIFTVDNREPYHMIVHSSGLSRDYVDEQELSFWEYRGDYWALVPMDLEIDTSHAHIMGENLYPDLDRDTLFEAFYYRDGIAYRPSRQLDLPVSTRTVKLGKMEEVQKNRIFRLRAVYESDQQGTTEYGVTYIEFEVKQDLPYITRECRYNDGGIFLYYLQLSGMEDTEKERRINTLLLEDVMKIAKRDDPTSVYDYEIEHKDDRFIRILYKDIQGGTVAAATLDIEEETISEKPPLFCRRQQEYLESDERDVYIDYPQLSGMADKEKEKRLNALIKKDVLKILERDTSDTEYCFTAGLDYEIKYLDDRIISILYKGWYGYITPGQGQPDTAMATTIDIEEEKILALKDAVADYDVLHDMLMADEFENTTKWDGQTGQYTISQEYDYEEVSPLMKDLEGDDEDIEWYIDDGHFVIVTLERLADYNEYANSLGDAEAFLKKDFWEKISPSG